MRHQDCKTAAVLIKGPSLWETCPFLRVQFGDGISKYLQLRERGRQGKRETDRHIQRKRERLLMRQISRIDAGFCISHSQVNLNA
jgi:hypothetical protein